NINNCSNTETVFSLQSCIKMISPFLRLEVIRFKIFSSESIVVSRLRLLHPIEHMSVLFSAFLIFGLVTPKGGRNILGVFPVIFLKIALVRSISFMIFLEEKKPKYLECENE